jgi:uncharacterized protein
MDATDIPQTAPRSWRKHFGRIVIVYGCIPYLSVTVLFTVFQRRLMYHPTVAESLSVAHVGLVADFARDVQILTEDGHTLHGWLIRHRPAGDATSEAPLVIYFPGNAGNRQDRIADLREVAASGFDVLVFDYRGFGDSTGSPSEWALTSDAQRAWQYACGELQYAPDRIVVFGESLGGAVALSLWATESPESPQPASVILNSTFTTMPDVVAWQYPVFPFRYLLLDHWPSVRHIPHVPSPVIVFHGTEDEIVPVNQGRTLASLSPQARFIDIPGATHNEIPMTQLRQELVHVLATIPPREPAAASPE